MHVKLLKIYEKIKKYIKESYKELIILAVFAFICLYDFPYVIYQPGGAINLNERISVKNPYQINGSYNMSYVLVSKGRIPFLILSYFNKDYEIKKKEDVSFNSFDYEQTFKIEQIEYDNSLALAQIVAYQKANKTVPKYAEKRLILNVTDKAKTDLKLFDEIKYIDGQEINSFEDIKYYINSKEPGYKVDITLKDDKQRSAYIYEENNEKYMGVSFINKIEFENNDDIKFIKASSEAGSSGGLMMTLAIFDLITKDDYAKGRKIMGTGTIELNGNIGPIGGVKFKLLGAERNDADIFFIPEENYEEALQVYKDYNLSFKLIKVNTFDEAIDYLK